MRRVTLGQPLKVPGPGSDRAWREWVETAIKQIEEASHVPDTGASQMTAVGLFVAFCASESFT